MKRIIKFVGVLLPLLSLSTISNAVERKSCEIKNSDVTIEFSESLDMTVLCNQAYTSYHSNPDRIPLLVSERVFSKSLSKKEPRTNDFRADTRLRLRDRAILSDYYKSGYDRGHMAPAGDTNDHKTISESFLLSNMTPQNPELNRTLWKNIETYARIKANLNREVVVLTGVVFNHCQVDEKLKDRVSVPDKYYKIIYGRGRVDAFMVDNIHPETSKIHQYRVELKDINDKLCGMKIKIKDIL